MSRPAPKSTLTAKQFQSWLDHMRDLKGWRQIDCAQALGSNETTIGFWKSGKSIPSRYIDLAMAALAQDVAPWSEREKKDDA